MEVFFIVCNIISFCCGGIIARNIKNNIFEKRVKIIQALSDKHFDLFILMVLWVKKGQQGKIIKSYFLENKVTTIAIYGISYVGECLIEELKNTDIEVKYAIDCQINLKREINIISPYEEFPKVDMIIVTAISFFDEIQRELMLKTDIPIVSIKEIMLLL